MIRYEMPKTRSIKQESKNSSRRDSLEGSHKKLKSNREEFHENIREYKFHQVKTYFKWKLEKWKDQDLE